MKSIYIIPSGRGYAIEYFGTYKRSVVNFPGYKLKDNYDSELQLIKTPIKPNWYDNIYFFFYPFYTKKGRIIQYEKEIGVNEIQPGDHELWRTDDDKRVVVLRKSYSDHVRLRNPMPSIASDVFTGDGKDEDRKVVGQMARIITKSNNIVVLNNIKKAFYSIDDTLLATSSAISTRHRSFVGKTPIEKMKGIEDDKGAPGGYFEHMAKVNNASDLPTDGISELFGYTLELPYFEAMRPGDKAAEELFKLMNGPAEAKLKKIVTVTNGEAEGEAYEAEWEPKTRADKKYGVETGKILVDTDGKVTGLRPDANVQAMADAIKELSKTTGTVIIGEKAMPTIPVGAK